MHNILDLLELNDIQDAIISSLGVEQRKRLTIGVELASKPSLLLFFDEPTSGLDSQSAFSIVRFLKKLARAGQAIVCTIHQPSSMLIQQLDMILALNPGGNTFYFGPVGENGSAVTRYFADRGTKCPAGKNVAEFTLETVAKGGTRGKDGKRLNWNKEWLASQDNKVLFAEIKRLKADRSKIAANKSHDKPKQESAASIWLQTSLLTRRTFIQYWRDPSYLYSKLFVSVIISIFNGFTFYQLDRSPQNLTGLQNRLFTPFVIVLIPPTIVNGVVPKFYQNRSLWEAREYPSRTYGAGRGRDPDGGFGRDGVLAVVVLARWSAWGACDKWIRVPDDGPVFPVYGKLGTVDLWLCWKLYGNFKRKSQSPPSEVWWRLKIMHSGAFLPQSNQSSHHGPHQAPASCFSCTHFTPLRLLPFLLYRSIEVLAYS